MAHVDSPSSRSRRSGLWGALAVTGAVLTAEAAGGILSGSLALLTDAGHVLTDLATILIALAAMTLSARPASRTHTFGWKRLEVLAALGNAFFFLLVILWVVWEALQRLSHPVLPRLLPMALVAAVGLAANGFSAWLLRHSGEDLNQKAAWLHVLGDLASSAGVLLGAGVMAETGWAWVDPLLSLGIAVLIGIAAFRLFWRAFHILLESAPRGLDPGKIAEVLVSEVPEIREVHHIHLWEVGAGEVHLTAHLVVSDRLLSEGAPLAARASALLKERLSIQHCTFQLESPALPF
jgi:cobalt-zinc-cadmium efflux system protein